ncbi:MAG: MFS transporter [Solirubrobacteraceae bacterium]
MSVLRVPEPIKSNKGFLRRVTAATALGEGLDGYDLGVISVVLPLISNELGLSSLTAGLIGASTLIGIFLGAPVVGYLTDRFGRKRLFTLDVIAFVVLGLLQLVVANAWELLVIRLLLGVAIGAEYAIGAAMMTELSPSKGRGSRLSYLQVCWYGGFLLAVVLAYVLTSAGVPWRWILATSAVPAVLTLVLRYGLPESPRWLMSRDRVEEARRIVNRYLGGEAYFTTEDLAGESVKPARFRELFAPEMRTRTSFVCIFWACLVAPYFAIFTFAPLVFSSLHISDQRAGTIAANGVAAVGAVAGMLLIERVGRRRLLISSFWITAVALFVIGGWSGAPGIVVVVCFAVFSLFNAASGDLTGVLPGEVFPSELRASGIGLAAAASRIGAALGTFLLPVGISSIGVGPSVIIGGAVCVLGAVVSHLWAPETTGLSLTQTSRAKVLKPDVALGPSVALGAD